MRGVSVLQGRQLVALLGAVVRAVVGEDRSAVEGAVVLREVQPALVADAVRALAADTDTDDVRRGVDELVLDRLLELVLGGLVDALEVVHEEVEAHGRHELLVLDRRAVVKVRDVAVRIDLGDALLELQLVLGQRLGDRLPDTAGAVARRELERGVRAPVAGHLLVEGVGNDHLQVRRSDTLTEPLALHQGRRHGPHLEVVRAHEQIGKTLACVSSGDVPIMRTIHSSKVLGGVVERARSSAASTIPSMHFTWSSTGSTVMLFW